MDLAFRDLGGNGPPIVILLGGLAAMGFAIAHPRMTAAAALIDIAPCAYPLDHEGEFQALRTDISVCRSRTELDALLAPLLPDPLVRQEGREGQEGEAGFHWLLNVAALESSTISGDFSGVTGRFEGPALFVAGGSSDYLREADHAVVLLHFPRALEAILDSFLAATSNGVQ